MSADGSFTDQALAYRQQAQALRAQGRHTAALDAYARAVAAARRAEDATLEAQIQIGLIDSLGVLGREVEAIDLGRRIEATLQKAGRFEDAARARMNVANLHYRRDRHSEALADFVQVTAVFLRAGNVTLAALADANAANALSYLGRLEEAYASLERAQAVFRREGSDPLLAMTEANLGYLHFLSGQHGRALAALNRALTFFESGTDRRLEAAKCRADRADVYHALNLLPEALADYEAASAFFQSVPLPYEAARAALGLAAVRIALGQTEDALRALEDADARFVAQGNRLHLGRVALLRAIARSEEEEARRAERLFVRARQFGWAAEARLLLAAGDLSHLRGIARTARRWSRGWLECRAYQAAGRALRERGALPAAIRAFRSAATALESVRTQLAAPEEMHVAFLGDKVTIYEDLIDALLERGRPRDRSEALSVLERSRSRLLRERLAQAGEAAPPETSGRLERLRRELSQAYHRLNGFPDETRRFGIATDRRTIADCEDLYREALREAELTARSGIPTRLFSAEDITPRTIAEKLAPGEAMLAYYCAATSIDVFVLHRGRPLVLRRGLCDRRAVQHAARRLRFHLQRPRISALPEVRTILGALYDLLLRPLESALTGVERLTIIPHGPLHGLPFHALHDGRDYTLDRWECLFAPSIALWQFGRTRPRATGGRALVMAVPTAGLPAVAAEARAVARRLPQALALCGPEAQREAFLRHAPNSRWIHLATHALFRSDNPLFSGLQLSDGWLLARDLYGLPLPRCDLATLSACQTGLAAVAPGDETFGLVRAFLAAGARTVVASLWFADDTATRILMEKFYEYATQPETGAGAALRRAQKEIRDHYPHPYHWAAFALAGQP